MMQDPAIGKVIFLNKYGVALVVKNTPTKAGDKKRHRFSPWVMKIP